MVEVEEEEDAPSFWMPKKNDRAYTPAAGIEVPRTVADGPAPSILPMRPTAERATVRDALLLR